MLAYIRLIIFDIVVDHSTTSFSIMINTTSIPIHATIIAQFLIPLLLLLIQHLKNLRSDHKLVEIHIFRQFEIELMDLHIIKIILIQIYFL